MLRVLIVEDDPAQLHALRTMLERAGHVVALACERGDDPRLAAPPPDLDVAIVDLNLPGQSGVEVIRALLDKRSTLPVLVLSASSHSAAITEALLAGALGYVVKGARMQELIDAVALVANKKPAFSPQAESALKTSGDVEKAVERLKRFI